MVLNINKFFSLVILLLTVSSVSALTIMPIGNTFVWWAVFSSVLIGFMVAKKSCFDVSNRLTIRVLHLYLFWNIICIVRGMFVAENYWEWKNLATTGMVLLLPLSIYISTNEFMVQRLVNVWVRFALPAFFIFLPLFKYGDAAGRYLVPISFLALFFNVLSKEWKVIVVLFVVFIIFHAPDARSNVIKYSVSLLLGLLYYVRFLFKGKLLELVRLVMFGLPIVLFILGVTGVFNVFKMDEYMEKDLTTTVYQNGEAVEEDLTTDTRTFLYEEVLFSAQKYNYVWFGRTPARGNESPSFGEYSIEVLKTGKLERFSNEVSILNIFTWTGVIGVILYFFVFFRASYLAVNRCNNTIIRIIGLFVSFRWVYAWVEDFNDFDLSYLFLWIMIGMCFSKSFRKMSDTEMKCWIKGIFSKRYRAVYRALCTENQMQKKLVQEV